jgi:hypothetical protein
MATQTINITTPSEATIVDFDDLGADQRRILNASGYDSLVHSIFRASCAILPVGTVVTKGKNKKLGLASVNRILVEMKTNNQNIDFISIFPSVAVVRGNVVMPTFEFISTLTRQVVVKATNQEGHKVLDVKNSLGEGIRKDTYAVYAFRSLRLAQWIFLDSWIRTSGDYGFTILVLIPDNVTDNRNITIQVDCHDKGRSVENTRVRRINLPANLTSSLA